MKAKFIGEPGTNESKNLPEVFEAYGVEFPQGEFVEVPDNVASKIAGNGHFEVSGEENWKAQAAAQLQERETIPELKKRVQTLNDLDILQQELQGETRDGGRKVLQDRIDDLLA